MLKKTPFYVLEHCQKNCPKTARNLEYIIEQLTRKLNEMFLKNKYNLISQNAHNIPKIGIAGCPNGCSLPQIKDLGLIGYKTPYILKDLCIGCEMCVHKCSEKALTIKEGCLELNTSICLSCGECIMICPSNAIKTKENGWKKIIGGRMGRHPRLAEYDGNIDSDDEAIMWILDKLQSYFVHRLPGERLSYFFERSSNS